MLASQSIDTLQVALRAFELRLLRDIGFLPLLNAQTATLAPLDVDAPYVLLAEAGLREAHDDDRSALSGAQWLALQHALDGDAPFVDTMLACINHLSELKAQLRALLHYHCDVKVLKTRQMMMELQSL